MFELHQYRSYVAKDPSGDNGRRYIFTGAPNNNCPSPIPMRFMRIEDLELRLSGMVKPYVDDQNIWRSNVKKRIPFPLWTGEGDLIEEHDYLTEFFPEPPTELDQNLPALKKVFKDHNVKAALDTGHRPKKVQNKADQFNYLHISDKERKGLAQRLAVWDPLPSKDEAGETKAEVVRSLMDKVFESWCSK